MVSRQLRPGQVFELGSHVVSAEVVADFATDRAELHWC